MPPSRCDGWATRCANGFLDHTNCQIVAAISKSLFSNNPPRKAETLTGAGMTQIVYAGEGCTGCKICSVACAYFHERAFNIRVGRIWVVKEEPLTDYPVVCSQCAKPRCQEVCPVGAIRWRDDITVVDENACIGCGACVEVCPFGAISLHPTKRVAMKCDLCNGGEPQCVKFCPAGVLKLQKRVRK